VLIDFNDGCDWSEADISAEGRAKLQARRALSRARLADTRTDLTLKPAAECR
jgi:hypothetical protein